MKGVLRVVPFKILFLTYSSVDHDKISMAYANIDALHAGSLGIEIAYGFPFTFYKLCVTKVAHCTVSYCLLNTTRARNYNASLKLSKT